MAFTSSEERALAKSMLDAFQKLRKIPALGEGKQEVWEMPDELFCVLNKFSEVVARWGDKSFEDSQGAPAPAFFQKMVPVLRNLSSRITSSSLAAAKAKVFEHKPDMQKMCEIVTKMFKSVDLYAPEVRKFAQNVIHLGKVVQNLETAMMQDDRPQIIRVEDVRAQYDAAVAAFGLDADLVEAAGLKEKLEKFFGEFKLSLEEFLETCHITVENATSVVRVYESFGCNSQVVAFCGVLQTPFTHQLCHRCKAHS